jgi:hypothetical protein
MDISCTQLPANQLHDASLSSPTVEYCRTTFASRREIGVELGNFSVIP